MDALNASQFAYEIEDKVDKSVAAGQTMTEAVNFADLYEEERKLQESQGPMRASELDLTKQQTSQTVRKGQIYAQVRKREKPADQSAGQFI